MPKPPVPTDWTRRAVSEVMTHPVQSVAPSETMDAVRRLLDRASFHHLPVVEDGRLVGMISVRDLALAALLECAPHGHACTARDVMSVAPTSIPPRCELAEAAQLMVDRRHGALPIVDPEGALLGIVTRTDLLRVLGRRGA